MDRMEQLKQALINEQAAAAALRAALEAQGRSYPDGQLCFCGLSIGNPMLREHTPQCQQARAALATDAGRPFLERLRRAEAERDDLLTERDALLLVGNLPRV